MAYTRIWDESTPKDQDRVFTGASEIRNLKVDFRERVNERCPIGGITEWPIETVPDMWLECDGSAISRVTYIDLFATIGTTFGEGDGSTTFNIPDLRGIFVRTWPHGVTTVDPDVAVTSFTATSSSGSPTLTSGTMTFLPRIGSIITGSGIPAGTSVLDATISMVSWADVVTITMSANATASGSTTITISSDFIGTLAHDENIKHTHPYYGYYRGESGVGNGWTSEYVFSDLSGGVETRPKNINIMYIIRATAL